jgi:hypothetical protein
MKSLLPLGVLCVFLHLSLQASAEIQLYTQLQSGEPGNDPSVGADLTGDLNGYEDDGQKFVARMNQYIADLKKTDGTAETGLTQQLPTMVARSSNLRSQLRAQTQALATQIQQQGVVAVATTPSWYEFGQREPQEVLHAEVSSTQRLADETKAILDSLSTPPKMRGDMLREIEIARRLSGGCTACPEYRDAINEIMIDYSHDAMVLVFDVAKGLGEGVVDSSEEWDQVFHDLAFAEDGEIINRSVRKIVTFVKTPFDYTLQGMKDYVLLKSVEFSEATPEQQGRILGKFIPDFLLTFSGLEEAAIIVDPVKAAAEKAAINALTESGINEEAAEKLVDIIDKTAAFNQGVAEVREAAKGLSKAEKKESGFTEKALDDDGPAAVLFGRNVSTDQAGFVDQLLDYARPNDLSFSQVWPLSLYKDGFVQIMTENDYETRVANHPNLLDASGGNDVHITTGPAAEHLLQLANGSSDKLEALTGSPPGTFKDQTVVLVVLPFQTTAHPRLPSSIAGGVKWGEYPLGDQPQIGVPDLIVTAPSTAGHVKSGMGVYR